ncbi:unnamed protein product [Prorocentrum cordatum]|uniref:Uncharacterized protein n=1 Tax=Prorocentrum cordatum TaxID=2364126 RepID=A0ABN9WDP6_9DINO|nr:unnamed protein product [Polarella glacialis]
MPCTTMHHPAAALLRAATCAGAPPHTRHAPRRGARAEPPGTPWRNSEHAAPLEHPARLPRLGRPVHLGGTAHLASALPPNSPHAVASAERAEARTRGGAARISKTGSPASDHHARQWHLKRIPRTQQEGLILDRQGDQAHADAPHSKVHEVTALSNYARQADGPNIYGMKSSRHPITSTSLRHTL